VIITWSSGAPDKNMDEGILVALSHLVSAHPWWAARADLVLALLKKIRIFPPSAILEAGCGWGTNFKVLEAAGYRVAGLDVSRKALDHLDRPHRQLIEADLSRCLPDLLPVYDCVLALDVIEHLDDDRRAVRELSRLLGLGGRMIVSVPALPELYSEFDEVQGHRRRYTAQSLRACIEGAGLCVEDMLWWGKWMVQPLRARKGRRRGKPTDTSVDVYRRYLALPPWPGPWAMTFMFRIDRWRTLRHRNNIGTSLIAIAGRPSP
jgi:SAM-dependent methyltransferase